jgi:hypothetical protein
MREIIKRSGRQENVLETSTNSGNRNENDNVLEPYFNALPVGKQLEVLKGGYQSMSKEFSKLGGKIEDPLITIVKPMSIQDELTNKLPILAVEKQLGKNRSDTDTTDTDSSDINTSS